ncbi:MAG: phospholipase D family protein [Flavobacteriales bacterium]|nr:phospholipase D family protein [Flavobacteriales bacterium]
MKRIIYFFFMIEVLAACGGEEQKEILSGPIETDFCMNIHRDDSITLSGVLQDLQDQMADSTGAYVLEDGDGAMVIRAWLCEYAEKTIDLQYFIFSTDNVGLIACDYLVRAADRGVKVRILVDDIMVDASLEDVLIMDAHPNIEVNIYNPGVNLGKNLVEKAGKFASDFRGANQRMHNKTFTVDGKVVITGGRNVADEYFDYNHDFNFRDRDVLLIGGIVEDVSTSFEGFWNHRLSVPVAQLSDEPKPVATETTYDRLHAYACDPSNFWPQVRERIEHLPEAIDRIKTSGDIVWLNDIRFIADTAGKNSGDQGLEGGGVTTDALIALVQQATSSIEIQTPYLITTDRSRALFKSVIDRGVRVRILTNSLASTDNVQAFGAYQSEREALLATGVEIYELRPDAQVRKDIMTGELQKELDHQPIFGLHAKGMVIDGHTTVIGTFNLDPRSANLNTECITIMQSDRIAEQVASHMEIEFQPENAWKITTDFNPDDEVSVTKQLKTWTMKALPKGIL